MLILRLLLCGLFLWGGCAEAFQVQSRPCPGFISSASTIVFSTSFEGSIASQVYTKSGDECPNTGTGTLSAPDIETSVTYSEEGGNSLRSVSTNDSTIIFSLPENTLNGSGRVGFWVRYQTQDVYMSMIRLYNSSNNYGIQIKIDSTFAKPVVIWEAGSWIVSDTSSVSISNDLFTFIEFSWDQSNNTFNAWINGTNVINDTSKTLGIISSALDTIKLTMRVGAYYDNIIVSSDKNEDLYAISNQNACE